MSGVVAGAHWVVVVRVGPVDHRAAGHHSSTGAVDHLVVFVVAPSFVLKGKTHFVGQVSLSLSLCLHVKNDAIHSILWLTNHSLRSHHISRLLAPVAPVDNIRALMA